MRKIVFFLLCAAMALAAVSCSNNDLPPTGPVAGEPSASDPAIAGLFILNSGKMGMNDASLAYFDASSRVVSTNVFKDANGKKLGDTGNSMLIYGKKIVEGIVCTMPTKLLGGDPDALPEIGQLYVDTGYSAHELKKMISIGSPIGFMPTYTNLLGGRLAGKAFDDKACGACAVHGVAAVKPEDMAGDVYFLFSAGEETSMMGAMTGGTAIMPDYAMVIDVTHAATPETGDRPLASFGSGAVLEYAPMVNRTMTNMLKKLVEQKEIPFTCAATGGSTGTNANRIWMTGDGVPTVLVSLPIKNMHSSTEVLDLRDAQAVADVVSAFICDKQIAEDFAR